MTQHITQELPELPAPEFYATDQTDRFNDVIYREGYDADQLRAYGQQCAAHAREAALSEALRRVRGATGGAIQPNDWWVGFKTARTQFTNAIEQLKEGK